VVCVILYSDCLLTIERAFLAASGLSSQSSCNFCAKIAYFANFVLLPKFWKFLNRRLAHLELPPKVSYF